MREWLDADIHVRGRPEWVFVKVFTHGCQSEDLLLARGGLDRLLDAVERTAADRGLALHYMTAREAVNVIRAAEAGRTGNPEDYRDFLYPPPVNTRTRVPEAPGPTGPAAYAPRPGRTG